METFSHWLANKSPPWTDYSAFMSGRLILVDKQPSVCPIGVGETWRNIFGKIVIKVKGPEDIMVCQDDQICSGLKVVIDGGVHGV